MSKIAVVDKLPAPFDWVEIPAGHTTIEYGDWTLDSTTNQYEYALNSTQSFEVRAFAIAKYPITNAQFKLFVDAGGYENEANWTREGWRQKRKRNWTQPRHWDNEKWNGAEQPVVGVSWLEAVAYCLWLRTETDENVMIPTEQQWQRAAQGDDQLTFPWGETWDAAKCNNSADQVGLGQTTPVMQYPTGASPYGVRDMTGNVWEWTLTNYEFNTNDFAGPANYRTLRGGAWDITMLNLFYTTARIRLDPESGNESFGFRIVRNKPDESE